MDHPDIRIFVPTIDPSDMADGALVPAVSVLLDGDFYSAPVASLRFPKGVWHTAIWLGQDLTDDLVDALDGGLPRLWTANSGGTEWVIVPPDTALNSDEYAGAWVFVREALDRAHLKCHDASTAEEYPSIALLRVAGELGRKKASAARTKRTYRPRAYLKPTWRGRPVA